MSRVPLAELRQREVWTCAEAARVLGRGAQWWAEQLDRGLVDGYRDGANRKRYVFAAAAREHIRSVGEQVRAAPLASYVTLERLQRKWRQNSRV
jgi:hypothetical protein